MIPTKRLASAAAVALAALLILTQVALADTEVGQYGDHLWTDDSSLPGAMCKYVNSAAEPAVFWLKKFTAPPPAVWWPDQDSASDTEHGTVGWRMTVQNDATGSYKTVTKSPYQKKTAYEDSQDPYGSSTMAPFSKITVKINGRAYTADTTWRVILRVNWYRPNGSVLGYATHTVHWYGEKLNRENGFSYHEGNCITRLQLD